MTPILTKTGVSQIKSESNLEFTKRTDKLASALGITVSALAKVIGISNGTLFAYRKHSPITRKNWSKLESVEKEVLQNQRKSGHLKEGGLSGSGSRASPVEYGAVASRLKPSDARVPTRADCEQYFQTILDAADASGDPSAFPVIMHRLKKQFPLDEFEQANE